MYKHMIPAETFYRAHLKKGKEGTPAQANGRLRGAAGVSITETDARRLERLIEEMRLSKEDLSTLQHELRNAQIVSSKTISGDVITMNSRARLRDLETGETMTYTLVFPD